MYATIEGMVILNRLMRSKEYIRRLKKTLIKRFKYKSDA